MQHGKFISIEGTEGAGKSTALRYVQACLQDANIQVTTTREPGGTDIAEEIRRVVLHRINNELMQPETELLLMFASRAQHIHKVILPALQQGQWVLCDRYVDASYAYQGGGRGVDINFIAALDHYVVKQTYPELTLLLDLPPEIGMQRTEQRCSGKDRIEKEKIDFFNRLREVYLQRAKQYPERIKIVDASQSIEGVQHQINTILVDFLQKMTHVTGK